MKRILLPLLLCLAALPTLAAGSPHRSAGDTITAATSSPTQVMLHTTEGDILLELFDDTPIHRDNFVRRVNEHFYDGLLFHRVIPEFVVQAGDSASRHALPGAPLGDSPDSLTLEPEFRFPVHYHVRGALGMARESDEENPGRRSSSTQFYIVNGRYFTDDALDRQQQRLDSATQGQVNLTPEIREAYRTEGGAPHLDGQYTVFGRVVSGWDVLDAIQFRQRDERNRPLDDVRIISARVL